MAQANCPHCGGTGWKTVEDGGGVRTAVRCDCALPDRAAQLFDRARIPPRYLDRDFENFGTDVYDGEPEAPAWNRSLAQAKLVLQAFARDFPTGSESGLLLMGPCGAGKTHLAVAALKEILQRGHRGLFYDYRELLKEIQASYNPESQATEMAILEPVLTAELLLLDDLGASKPSAWALDTVGHILNSRYNEKRVTLMTTNFPDPRGPASEPIRAPGGEALPRLDECLADRVGQRIRSRLYEMCRTVSIEAGDFRQRIQHASHR